MRIRNYRQEDLPTLLNIEQAAREAEMREALSETEFVSWLTNSLLDAFVITDDDDELNTWGQAGTLDGIEGEIVGYTTVTLLQEPQSYHLRCIGAVHPQFRGLHAGRALLICALNRARIMAIEFEFEAEQEGMSVYFEALLPIKDLLSPYLAVKCEMELVDAVVGPGFYLYRREL